MNSNDLIKLLSIKHSKDVFVPECKNGPSITGPGHRRMDAWAMRKSWSNPRVWAYEVKVSRSDFLRDDKWHEYLECCNELYFVCPNKLISPDEVPAEVGLLWASSTGSKLFVKKKAPTRNEQIKESVFRYILMSRSTIGQDYDYRNREYWGKWLEHERLDYEFGSRVSRKIRERVDSEVTKVRNENSRIQTQIQTLEYLRDRMIELGLDPTVSSEYRIDRALEKVTESVPSELRTSIRNTIRDLPKLAELLGIES